MKPQLYLCGKLGLHQGFYPTKPYKSVHPLCGLQGGRGIIHSEMTRKALLLSLFTLLAACGGPYPSVEGDLVAWHRVTVSFPGPATSEEAEANPFRDYRLTVLFRNEASGKTVDVPGFYAADGNAAETSATAGSVWRAHFLPSEPGAWQFTTSFRTATDIALNEDPQAGEPTAFDGASGMFIVEPADPNAPGFLSKGTLDYVGEHYLRFAETGEYFLKGGADSPENFLGYAEFDQTKDADAGSGSYEHIGEVIHHYEPHVQDWNDGDPTWQDGKGKGMIGALNYLASEGMNSVYFLTYNLDEGDGRDVWMWSAEDVRDRFDVSKLDQWEIVFDHMDRLGLMLHVVIQETENDRNLGGDASLNPIRKLYLRELIARYAHHPAIMWNLGEENNTPDKDRKEISAYMRSIDPYDHPITVHTHNNRALEFYRGILGAPNFEASSIQSHPTRYYQEALGLSQLTAEAGRPWVIFGDEQAPASHGVIPDADDPEHDEPRIEALWGNLMGGGSGVEWYFGHQYAHMDINMEDWRSRDIMWDQTRYALEFFHEYLPFWEMTPDPDRASVGRTLAKGDDILAIQIPAGGASVVRLGEGEYTIRWFDPRNGGSLQEGSFSTISGPGEVPVGAPPSEPRRDWVTLLVRQ